MAPWITCCHAVRGRRLAADQPAAHWPASHDAASRTAWRRHGSGGWGACRQARPAGSAAPLCGQPAAGRCRWPAASWSSLPASSSSPRMLGWLGWVATWPVPAAASAAVAAKALRPTSCRPSSSLRWPATRRNVCVRCSELVLGLGCGPPLRSAPPQDSFLDEGFILDKRIGVGQPKRVEDARILVANTGGCRRAACAAGPCCEGVLQRRATIGGV